MIMILGCVGNGLNIIILTRPKLFKYASSHYFLAMSINNLFGSSFVPLLDFLTICYGINLTQFSNLSCKLIRYFNDLCGVLAMYFIVLALMDRFLISSFDIRRRQWSSIKNARLAIICLVSCFAFLYINNLILNELDFTDQMGCTIRTRTIYHKIYSIFQIILFTVLAPTLMIIFGILTIYNAQRIRYHVQHVLLRRRTERQLSFMLLVQIGVHLILIIPISIFFLLFTFFYRQLASVEFQFWFIMIKFFYDFSYVVPFFLYTMTSRTFKNELVALFKQTFSPLPVNYNSRNIVSNKNVVVPLRNFSIPSVVC